MVKAWRRVKAVLGDQRSASGKLAVDAHLRWVIYFDGFWGIADEKIAAHVGNLLRSVFRVTLCSGGSVQMRTCANQHTRERRAIGIRGKVCILRDHLYLL